MFNSQLELIATGIWPGEKALTNEALARRLWRKYKTDGTPDGEARITTPEDIYERLGVSSRPVTTTQTHTEMFNASLNRAIQDAQNRGYNVEGNIVALFAATSEDTKKIPNFLHNICAHAGMHPNHYRESISQACAGFNNGVTRLSSYVEANPKTAGYAIVGAAEILTPLWKPDNFDLMLFGDVAGAAIFKITPSPNLPPEKRGVIGCVNIHTPDTENRIIRGEDGFLYMNGRPVQQFAPPAMIETCKRSLTIARLTPREIDMFVFHPGSAHVYNTLKRRVDRLVGRELPLEMVPHYLENFGNNGAVTTLNTLHQERQAGRIKPGMKIYVGAVGMGFYESGFVLQT